MWLFIYKYIFKLFLLVQIYKHKIIYFLIFEFKK